MNIQVNITLSADEALLAALNAIGGKLKTTGTEYHQPESNGQAANGHANGSAKPAASTTSAKSVKTNAAPAEGAVPAATDTATAPLKIEDVRAAIQKAQEKEDNTQKIKDLLKEFKVEKISGLKLEQYAPFIEKVNAL